MDKYIDTVRGWVGGVTQLGVALLAMAIVGSLLLGSNNMLALGGVVDNITGMITTLGNAGLAGLISLGVVVYLIAGK
jgi:hypothetical protein